LNGQETDVDCGGPNCGPCAAKSSCSKDGDCRSGRCDGGTCAAPTCSDGLQNGNETGTDCGGRCGPCATGTACRVDGDCQSGVCLQGSCRAPSCNDGVENGSETDTDCGSSQCGGCSAGASCQQDSDCASQICDGGTCQQPTCSDGVKNGRETGTDCGGLCGACPDGEDCRVDDDCQSGVCSNRTCQQPTCSDGVANGRETDIDCGGPKCPGCQDGRRCSSDSDCQNLCSNKTCVLCENGQTRTRTGQCGYKNRGDLVETCQGNRWQRTNCKGVWYRDCQEIYDAKSNPPSGNYTIDPDAPSGSLKPFQVRCEMVDGAGWIKVKPDDPNGDGLFTASHNSGRSQLDKCGVDILRYHDVDFGEGSIKVDYKYNNGRCGLSTSANPLKYRNPATGSNFTTGQMQAIRKRVTKLHPDTRHIAYSCDDDGNNPGHEAYIYDRQGNRRNVTPGGTTGSQDAQWYVHHTTSGKTTSHSANSSATKLSTDEILPTRLDYGHYAGGSCGGGVLWSYEKGHALVR
jgi:hypothetical protein